MKKIKLLSIGILSVLLFLVSCNKDDDTSPQNSDTVTGVYSGVLVGSTGAYELNLTENGATSTVLFDDTNYNLSSNETLENGQSITLTDGTISLVITVDNNGENPGISFTIPGHNIQATISTTTNTNNETGNYIGGVTVTKNGVIGYKTTFNLTLYDGNKFQGITKIVINQDENGNNDSSVGNIDIIDGTYIINNNIITFTYVIDNNTVNESLNIVGNTLQESNTDVETGLTEILLTKV